MGLKVLVVDDEPINRLVLGQMLQAFSCETHEAEDGPEALEMLEAESFELVLLDIHMAVMSGFEVVSRIRQSALNQNVHVVAVTADTSRHRDEYIAAHFDDYLNKPIPVRTVQEMIGVLLSRDGRAAA